VDDALIGTLKNTTNRLIGKPFGLAHGDVCYLCSLPVAQSSTDDHAVPKQLISRAQPKAKGFDYGGVLPTHAECNNRFGPETYCTKALRLIEVLYDPKCVSKFQHKNDPSIRMMALNSECFKGFTKRDLAFFKFIDVRDKSVSEFLKPSFFSGKPKAIPIRDALFVALAVLTKSTAALLVARHLHEPPASWKVLAIPYTGATEAHDFDSIFGNTKPFDIGVKVWLRRFESGDWFALYRARNVLVFFLFRLSSIDDNWNGMLARFKDAERLSFSGARLTDVIDYEWQRV